MVVAVSIHFSTSGLSACSMRMRYSSGLIGEGIYGSRHIIAPQEIALHGLCHTALDVIVVCGINLVAATKYRCHTCSQGTFSIARSIIREIAVIETCLRTESVTVIEVLHKYIRSRSGHFVGTSPLFRQAVQPVVLVLEGILVEIGRALIHGLQHKAEVAFVVIHIVGIVRFAAFHLTRQYNMSHLVGEGVARVQVFIGGFNNRKLTGSTAAVARQCACTAYTIVDAVQLRVSRTVAQIVRIDGMTATSVHDLNYLNDVREDITTA